MLVSNVSPRAELGVLLREGTMSIGEVNPKRDLQNAFPLIVLRVMAL